jgi:predicted nucleic-acid-binding protein
VVVYEVGRFRVAELMRAAIALPSVIVLDARLLLRALELYETERLDFAEAYLLASAEATGVEAMLSFDRASTGSRPSRASSPNRAARESVLEKLEPSGWRQA